MSLWRTRIARQLEARGYAVQRSLETRVAALLDQQRVTHVIDVGAAKGLYGAGLRRRGYRGPIASYEPLPESYEVLEGRARDDGHWATYPLALGPERRSMALHVASNGDSSSLLAAGTGHLDAAPSIAFDAERFVDVVRLDEHAATTWARDVEVRAFLKMDVQGFELSTLAGASGLLSSIVGVQSEVSFVPLYEGGADYREFFAKMDELGFAPVEIAPGFRSQSTAHLMQADVVFVRSRADGG